ncbi:MAG: D-glycerate dehydrogenase [Chloroflexi bacterium]|nr:D-glycerate dehydrogenase [Chloroflexota bacterium]
MAKPKVYVTRKIPETGLEILRAQCDITVYPEALPVPRAELLQEIKDVDGVLTLLTEKVDAEFLDHAPRVKVVSNMAVGFDNIDVKECTRRGIPVGNTPEVLTDTTADMAFTLLLSAARHVGSASRYVLAGKWKTWEPLGFLGYDIHGATLGIIGLGRIGAAVARRARGFNMNILYYDAFPRRDLEPELGLRLVSVDEILAQSDFITVHTPMTPETYHMIGEAQLRKMKPNAVIVNTARGGIIDPKALYKALKEGWIAAAGLDVTEPEPIPMDDPLLTLDNCLIVPHIASASFTTRSEMSAMAARNVLAGIHGERLPTCVNPEVYQK